jgi:hypothetical protein
MFKSLHMRRISCGIPPPVSSYGLGSECTRRNKASGGGGVREGALAQRFLTSWLDGTGLGETSWLHSSFSLSLYTLNYSHPSSFANSLSAVELPTYYHEFSFEKFPAVHLREIRAVSHHPTNASYVTVRLNSRYQCCFRIVPFLLFSSRPKCPPPSPKKDVSDISNVSGSVRAVKNGKKNS